MKKRGSATRGRSSSSGAVLGRDRFAKISAVEGIELSEAARKRAAKFDRQGLSAEERVRAIVTAHRKG